MTENNQRAMQAPQPEIVIPDYKHYAVIRYRPAQGSGAHQYREPETLHIYAHSVNLFDDNAIAFTIYERDEASGQITARFSRLIRDWYDVQVVDDSETCKLVN